MKGADYMAKFTHQISKILLATIFLFAISGCVTINLDGSSSAGSDEAIVETPEKVATAAPTINPPGLSEETILNGRYLSPMLQAPIQLQDGKFAGVAEGVELTAQIQAGVQFGDLNTDGIDDAAFLLAENTGGSGTFVSLLVVYSQADHFQQAAGITIDDRPMIDALSIENGMVIMSGLIHGPNDAMVDPKTRIHAEWTLLGDRLVKTRLSSAFAGGAEHVIFIESPMEGEAVSGSFILSGSMPIGPFENTLSLVITDPLTGQLVHEGFMVDAADMGAPATFNNVIQVPAVPAGTELLVSLLEISMADGAPIAIDSVRVIVR
jgi:hypothetical protein